MTTDSDKPSPQGNVVDIAPRRVSKFDRLFAESQAMEAADAFQAGQVGYVNRVMIQATLPYREPKGSPPIWGRRAGNWSLVIQPGMYLDEKNTPKSLGYPYGATPRLVLAWLGGEVKRQKKQRINLGNNLASFLAELGVVNASGGKRGTIGIAKDQMRRLFASRIALVQSPSPADVSWSMDGMQVAEHQLLWWGEKSEASQDSLFDESPQSGDSE